MSEADSCATSAGSSVSEERASRRLLSIDALRGFDMFWIMGGDSLIQALGRWYGEPLEGFTAWQLEHAEWVGFRFYDLIFPLFLFLVGVVIPFSIESHTRRGERNSLVHRRILRRTLLLIALGLLCNGILRLDFPNQRYAGVLQRIGICYGITALLAWKLRIRTLSLIVVAILLGYWAILTFVPPPGGTPGDLSPSGNLAGYLDRSWLPGKIMKAYYGYGDNEGLLSTLPAVATTLIGALTGFWLNSKTSTSRKIAGLATAGLACLAVGFAWANAFPIIKNLWTSTFVLVAAGWSLLLLTLFHGIIDLLGWRRWAFFFAVIGANAITIYVVPRFIDFSKISTFFLGGLAHLSGDFGPVLLAAGLLAAEWLFLLYLYRNRLFLRV